MHSSLGLEGNAKCPFVTLLATPLDNMECNFLVKLQCVSNLSTGRWEPVRPAQDLQLQVVFPHCSQHLGDPLAIDGPSGQVAEVDEVGKAFKKDLKCIDGELGCLVDVEALEGRVIRPGDTDAHVGVS